MARIASKSGVIRDVGDGEAVGGYPAMPVRDWHRQSATNIRLSQRRPTPHDERCSNCKLVPAFRVGRPRTEAVLISCSERSY
jgi:hypothetical protein